VKVCGVTRVQDARCAGILGAWAVGVILFSTSPRSVPLLQAREIFEALPASILRVAVSDTTQENELAQILSLSPDAIQIYHPFVLPKTRAYRVFRVCTNGMLPADCDAVVLDESHGRGRPYDPATSRKMTMESTVPVILSGGLTPRNVARAIATIQPFAVDVSSGVEVSIGCKDPELMEAFFAACKEESI
jgi:phosphoribosylanthranilate isomerase